VHTGQIVGMDFGYREGVEVLISAAMSDWLSVCVRSTCDLFNNISLSFLLLLDADISGGGPQGL
jgi:hypothetical protein